MIYQQRIVAQEDLKTSEFLKSWRIPGAAGKCSDVKDVTM